MIYLEEVFDTLTLQTGTIVLSTLFITLAVYVLLVNSLSFDVETPWAWIIMFTFVSFMFIIWFIAILGAYKESCKIITTATVSWTFYSILWTGLVLWSLLTTQSNKDICLEFRCPSGLWLLYNPRTENAHSTDGYNNNMKKRRSDIRPVYEKSINPQIVGAIRKYKSTRTKNERNDDAEKTTAAGGGRGVSYETRVTANNGSSSENAGEKSSIEGSMSDMEAVDEYCRDLKERDNVVSSAIASALFSLLYALIVAYSWRVLISYRREILLHANLTSNDVALRT